MASLSKEQQTEFYEHVAEVKKDLDTRVSDSESLPSSPELASSVSSRDSISSIPTPVSPDESGAVADSFVFAFDIDGVLVRGGNPIPEAIEAMKVLDGENEYGMKM
jgi:hypothetical protein